MIPIECENTFPIAGLQLKNWGNNCGKLAHVDVLGFGASVDFELSLKTSPTDFFNTTGKSCRSKN